MEKLKSNPTMTDVAKLAGVSQMTVSRVLRKKGYISEKISKKVHDAARELGYVQNKIAGGLAGEATGLVGVILPTLKNRVFNEVLSGITAALSEVGSRPLFGVSEYNLKTEENIIKDLLSWRPKGLIISGLEHTKASKQMLKTSNIKIAEIMDTDGNPTGGCFGFSNTKVGENMAKHLLGKGYLKFAYIGNEIGHDTRADKRCNAFVKTIAAAGGELVREIRFQENSSTTLGRALTAKLLEDSAGAEVIYYSNDDVAAGGLMHCISHNISVPKEIALASFNGLNFLEALPLQITTTKSPRYEIGYEAANYIISSNNNEPPKIEMPCKIIAGETS